MIEDTFTVCSQKTEQALNLRQFKTASKNLKAGVNFTIARMNQRDARGMIQYFWSAVIGTERSVGFAAMMKEEGFDRFEEAIDDFRIRFGDEWIASR